jgi:CBS domain-containing protein
MRRSIMTEKIARRGYHIYREYGVDPLERHFVDEVMTRDVETIDASVSARDALLTFFGPTQARRAWPVVRDGVVLGVVDRATLDKLLAKGADNSLGALLAAQVPDVALPAETCRQVATRLALHGLERLPVVADRTSMRLLGIISRSDLVKLSLAHFEEEHKKERFRRIRIGNGKRRFAPVRPRG